MDICSLCNENWTGRLIQEIAVCHKCFVEGRLNLPENQAILKEVLKTPYEQTTISSAKPRGTRKNKGV